MALEIHNGALVNCFPESLEGSHGISIGVVVVFPSFLFISASIQSANTTAAQQSTQTLPGMLIARTLCGRPRCYSCVRKATVPILMRPVTDRQLDHTTGLADSARPLPSAHAPFPLLHHSRFQSIVAYRRRDHRYSRDVVRTAKNRPICAVLRGRYRHSALSGSWRIA